jgi:hypothetical protein
MVGDPTKRVPPPPPIANFDPMFNHWLHDLTSFLMEGGGIDPGAIPGYATLLATTATHTIQINSNTTDIAALHSEVSSNTTDIATNTANIATNTANIAANTASINVLAARSQVLNGATAPAAGLGVNGDWYADTAAHHIHVKVSGSWVQIV